MDSKQGNNGDVGAVGAVFGDAKRPLSGEFEPKVTEPEPSIESITSCEPTEDPINITLVVILTLMIIVFISLLVYHLTQIWATPPPKAE